MGHEIQTQCRLEPRLGYCPGKYHSALSLGHTANRAGAKKIIINPQLATLTESKIKVPFKDGAIIAEYKKDGSIEKYAFTIPQNMNVEFVGDYDSKKVTVNNKKVKDKGGIRLVPGVNTLIFIQ